MTTSTSSPDQRALEAIRSSRFDPLDPLTQPAVDAFLSPYRDTDPVTGLPVVDTRESLLDPWPGETDEHGERIYHPTAHRIMHRTHDATALSDEEVLTLVLSCTDIGTYLPGEWELYVEQQKERSSAYLASSNKASKRRYDTRERQSRARTQHRLEVPPKGYRNATLSHGRKLRMTASLKAAEERRDRRRTAGGTIIIPGRRVFQAMTLPEKIELRQTQEDLVLKNAAALQVLDELMEGPDVDHVGFLYRYGRSPRPKMEESRLTVRWARGTL